MIKKQILFLATVFLLVSSGFSQKGTAHKTMKVFHLPDIITVSDYLPKTIIFKVKPEYRYACKAKSIDNDILNNVLASIGAVEPAKKFPRHTAPVAEKNERGDKFADLSLMYEVKYANNIPIEKAINAVLSTGVVEYAEPHYLPKVLFTPDDPLISSQYHLAKIKAYQAWDVTHGDTNIVIGIVDTGTDFTHADLVNNVKYNWEDPINGIDDDNDGYIDNFMGWDLGENDNDPQVNADHHGSHVCGISSASTNNSIGVAGVGFDCKFLPVKIDDNGVLSWAYEGIVYAADHGCSVINCSWGGPGQVSEYAQEIINYATINQNALVVAACGNTPSEMDFYPASYNYVISVAATDSNDCRWYNPIAGNGTTYSVNVDVSAPGVHIYSTWYDDGHPYIFDTGTSDAAPIACGCAALIKKQFPFFNAIQIGEQLKMTTDFIDTIPSNIPYAGKLGTGRVNLFKALTTFNKSSVRMTSQNYTAEQYGNFSKNDTLHICGDFTNYLSPTTNLEVTASCASPYIQVLDSTVTLGAMATLGIKNNNANPFNLLLLPNIPLDQEIQLKLSLKDGTNYSAVQYLTFIVNNDYLNIDTNRIAATITSKGRLGYNVSNQQAGIGFTYNGGISLMSCGSLMIGVPPNKVSDMVYSYSSDSTILDNDFCSEKNAKRIIPPKVSDFDIVGSFNDSCAGSTKLSVLVKHRTYAWNNPQDEKYIILDFTIINRGNNALSSLYAGYYVDWDIGNKWKNRTSLEVLDRMGYTYSTSGGVNLGIKLLTNGPFKHYAFDNNGLTDPNNITISDGFTGLEKYQALSSITNRNNAGGPTGNNVSDMVITGPFILLPHDSVTVAFALIAGDHLADIKASAAAAQQKYSLIYGIHDIADPSNLSLNQNVPNPFQGNSMIDFYLPEKTNMDLSIYDVLGKRVATIASGMMYPGTHSVEINSSDYETGLYYYRLRAGNHSITKKMVIY